MKNSIIAILAAALFTACGNKNEKTAAAAETNQQKPVVAEKVKYVPVQQQPAATSSTVSQKQGWSKAAKGAVIGGAGGALVGGAVSTNKPAGAIIGGAIGAGTGYLIGHGEDKKDGRVKHKTKTNQ